MLCFKLNDVGSVSTLNLGDLLGVLAFQCLKFLLMASQHPSDHLILVRFSHLEISLIALVSLTEHVRELMLLRLKLVLDIRKHAGVVVLHRLHLIDIFFVTLLQGNVQVV